LISNHFRDSVGGPEKAGVGGSIPSLATIIHPDFPPVRYTFGTTKVRRLYKARPSAQSSVKGAAGYALFTG